MIAVFEWLHAHPWMMLPIAGFAVLVGLWWGRRRPSSGPPYRWTPEPTEDDEPYEDVREPPKPVSRPPRRSRRASANEPPLFPDIGQLMAPMNQVMRDLQRQVERFGGRATTSWRVDHAGPTTIQIPATPTGSRVTLEDETTHEILTYDIPAGETRSIIVSPRMRVSVTNAVAAEGPTDSHGSPSRGNPAAKVRHVQETPKEPPKPRTWHERLLDDEDEEAPCLKKTAKSKD